MIDLINRVRAERTKNPKDEPGFVFDVEQFREEFKALTPVDKLVFWLAGTETCVEHIQWTRQFFSAYGRNVLDVAIPLSDSGPHNLDLIAEARVRADQLGVKSL
jgi:hypothetical protein